jgi:AcrR family transcriptional regulator
MDEVTKRVGIAKGSLYLHTDARKDLVTRVLDRWAAGVKKPDSPAAGSYEERHHQICEALFANPEPRRKNAKKKTAFPCYLHTSPYPYGWAESLEGAGQGLRANRR